MAGEIAGKNNDARVEAEFDPQSGVVAVFRGRPELGSQPGAPRRIAKRRVHEYVPCRMLEVEAPASAVYQLATDAHARGRQ